MTSPFNDLFETVLPDSRGGRIYFKVFELFVVVSAIHLAWKWAGYIPRLTDTVEPVGLAAYINLSFVVDPVVAWGMALALTASASTGFVRIRLLGRYGYAVAFMLMLVLFAARFSQGKIPHSANLVGMAVLALALGMLLFRNAHDRARFVLGFTYFYVGLAYTLAGIAKLVGTGLTWPDGRHLWMWINEKSIDVFAKYGQLDLNWVQHLALDHRLFATAMLTFGWVTELTAFLLWWERFRRPLIVLILMLHFGIWMSMNIMFKLSIFELVILLLPLPMLIDRYGEKSARSIVDRLDTLTARIF